MGKQEEKKSYILFDIDSDSIGVVVFEKIFVIKGHKKESFYREIFSQRKKIINSSFIDFKVFFIKTKQVFDELALLAYSHTHSLSGIDNIYLNISAPWVTNQKRVLHFEKQKSFIYNNSIVEEVLEKQKEKTSHHTRDYHAYNNLDFVDHHILSLSANGYPVKNLSGKKIKDLDIHTLVSFISPESRDMFYDVIERHFHRKPKIVSNIFMEYFALQKLFPKEKNILALDVSAEITEVFLIQKGILICLATIPVGSNTIKRSLAEGLNLSFEKASSLLSLYSEKKMEEKFELKINKVMQKSFLSWFKEVYATFSEISKEHHIPHTLSLVANADIQQWLQEWLLKSDEVEELFGFGKKLELLDSRFALFESLGHRSKEISDESLLYAITFLEKYKD